MRPRSCILPGVTIALDLRDKAADLAKRVGSTTAGLAKRIGPKRGLIGLAVLAVAVGGTIVLVRYLRSRDEDVREGLDEELAGDEAVGGKRNRRGKRNASYSAAQTIR